MFVPGGSARHPSAATLSAAKVGCLRMDPASMIPAPAGSRGGRGYSRPSIFPFSDLLFEPPHPNVALSLWDLPATARPCTVGRPRFRDHLRDSAEGAQTNPPATPPPFSAARRPIAKGGRERQASMANTKIRVRLPRRLRRRHRGQASTFYDPSVLCLAAGVRGKDERKQNSRDVWTARSPPTDTW